MKSLFLRGASLAALCTLALPAHQLAAAQTADHANVFREVIVVTGELTDTPTTLVEAPLEKPVDGADAASLLARMPGGARNGNGPLSGQVQYRGLYGERLNLRVDSQRFASGGPNLMDPVFHYAPTTLLSAIEFDRGVSPVRDGPGLAGGANAIFKQVGFSQGGDLNIGWDITTQGRTVDDSAAIGGVAGASTDTVRFNVLGAYESGGDASFDGGEIRGTRYERGVYGVSAGARLGGQTFGMDVRRQNTGPSGNPPFPMDIRYFDADFARVTWAGEFGDLDMDVMAHFADVAHAMNNYDLRPGPAAAMLRETYAGSTTRGLEAGLSMPLGGGTLRVGADGDVVDRSIEITNPANPNFRIGNIPDVKMQRAGAFGEWTGAIGPVSGELGMRVDRHVAEAGLAWAGSAVPAGVVNLANVFNAADRSHETTTVDAVARLWSDVGGGFTWRGVLAHKTRAPGYLERFAWLPTSASGGLADGNIYIGDMNLDPERAIIGEIGFDYAAAGFYIRPTVFVRQIDDYIQGVPFDATPGVLNTPQEMVASMNGDPTPLRFANVDARLYGVDLDAGVRLGGGWRIDAVASYVRGERRDIDDNLYRVSPPSLTAGLSYDAAKWSATVETRVAAEQDDVSVTNSEAATDGYALLNLYGDWLVTRGVRLSAGVENVLDERYEDHLGGYNQIGGSDVPLGERLPGVGRGAFLRLNVAG